MNNTPSLCVTIRKGKKEYQLWGIRHVEKKPSHLTIYTQASGQYAGWVYIVKNARITDTFITSGQINDPDTIATLERLEKA